MTEAALFLRDKAEAALRLAQVSAHPAIVYTLVEDAVWSLGRADAIELVERLREVSLRDYIEHGFAVCHVCLPENCSSAEYLPLHGTSKVSAPKSWAARTHGAKYFIE